MSRRSAIRKTIYLETSSYLPLIWRTPYSRSVVDLLVRHAEDSEFVLQRDCVIEASGYLSFEEDWRYNPSVRIRNFLTRMSDDELNLLSYPSTAVQLLLGGNIWPQAQYLNFVRHTAFFFIDLCDNITFENPRRDLTELCTRIDHRLSSFRELFQRHAAASEICLPTEEILSYWGQWYLLGKVPTFTVRIIPDPRAYNLTHDKLRDIYHYECAAMHTPQPLMMIVANTGFERNVKTSFVKLPYPVVCAKTIHADIFDQARQGLRK